jgi:hypothetical protein
MIDMRREGKSVNVVRDLRESWAEELSFEGPGAMDNSPLGSNVRVVQKSGSGEGSMRSMTVDLSMFCELTISSEGMVWFWRRWQNILTYGTLSNLGEQGLQKEGIGF